MTTKGFARTIWILIALFGFSVAQVGCAAYAKAPVTGFLFSDVRGPESVGSGSATKSGEACANSILGLVATGDASIEAARRAGGITEIAYVDHHSTSILGIFATYCVQVRGR